MPTRDSSLLAGSMYSRQTPGCSFNGVSMVKRFTLTLHIYHVRIALNAAKCLRR